MARKVRLLRSRLTLQGARRSEASSGLVSSRARRRTSGSGWLPAERSTARPAGPEKRSWSVAASRRLNWGEPRSSTRASRAALSATGLPAGGWIGLGGGAAASWPQTPPFTLRNTPTNRPHSQSGFNRRSLTARMMILAPSQPHRIPAQACQAVRQDVSWIISDPGAIDQGPEAKRHGFWQTRPLTRQVLRVGESGTDWPVSGAPALLREPPV